MPLSLLPDTTPVTPARRESRAVTPETKLDRLLKMIPTEVIAAYPAVLALSALVSWPYYEATIAALGVAAVVLVLRRDGIANHVQPPLRQYVVRCLAFAAWTLVIGNPLAPLSVSSEQAHLFGAVGAAFIPVLGYLTLPLPGEQ